MKELKMNYEDVIDMHVKTWNTYNDIIATALSVYNNNDATLGETKTTCANAALTLGRIMAETWATYENKSI